LSDKRAAAADPVFGRTMSDEEIAKRLAATFGELSLEEREEALHDIHGVGRVVEETPELVATSLEKLANEVQLIQDKSAYETAVSQSPDFVSNREFQMKFLRAERFDVRKAAQRMVYHFVKKLELFGGDALSRDIGLSDLQEDGVDGLRSGFMRILPFRDQAGRLIIFYAKSLFPPNMTILTRVRSFYHHGGYSYRLQTTHHEAALFPFIKIRQGSVGTLQIISLKM
jgi:hypothetical protein